MNRTTTITSGFWYDRCRVNALQAIFHQWEQLEASGCIDNFRIAAGKKDGCRVGWFFADSDAYKWLDAAARLLPTQPANRLASLVHPFIQLIAQTQCPDGYLFTYNQIHFPGMRWVNLQIEHELYCHGHLIEAGVSHYENTRQTILLDIARRAADRIVQDFSGKGACWTPGHQEIEIALLRLHGVTKEKAYLNLATQFIEQRGRDPLFSLSVVRQNASMEKRSKQVRQSTQAYLESHPGHTPPALPPGNQAKKPPFTTLRWYYSALSGKYFQQHKPVRQQTVPVGHAVRFAYLETAIARLIQENGDKTLLPALKRAWEHMVKRRMYITGGIGSLPGLEGFGNDFELDAEYAYAETCAALASLYWNWEMAQLTAEAQYSDLFEWQLYNAAAVGMGLDGKSYLYNNPLTCRGAVNRQPWFAIPCCPSNLSRTWADLDRYIVSQNKQGAWVHQYISSLSTLEIGSSMEIQSDLPWNGKVQIEFHGSHPPGLHLRLPSWSNDTRLTIGGQAQAIPKVPHPSHPPTLGYDPHLSQWLTLHRTFSPGEKIELELDLSLHLRRAHPRVTRGLGKVALTRGPLVYCLESTDQPEVDIFQVVVDAGTLYATCDPQLLGGVVKIEAQSTRGEALTFIPYCLWGNRGASQMTVWVNS